MLRLFAAVFLTGLVVDAQSTSSSTPLSTSTKIIGGTATTITSYPYLVSIERYQNSRWKHDCGGTILSSSFVLTAAHCVTDTSARLLRVRAGSTTPESGGQVRRLTRISIHSKYDEDTDDYDAAVLQLSSRLTLSTTVKAISMVRAGSNLRVGRTVNISGWGVTETGDTPTQLMHTSLQTVSRSSCSTAYRNVATITTRMMCAYTRNKDTCQGDSGGPVVSTDGVQLGITSFGYGCAEVGYPGVYADLANSEINSFVLSVVRAQSSSQTSTSTTTTTTTTPRPSSTATTARPRPSTTATTARPTSGRPSSTTTSSSQGCYTGSSSRFRTSNCRTQQSQRTPGRRQSTSEKSVASQSESAGQTQSGSTTVAKSTA